MVRSVKSLLLNDCVLILNGEQTCRVCRATQGVAGLAAGEVMGEANDYWVSAQENGESPVFLTHIRCLPAPILASLREAQPGFQRFLSITGDDCYANICRCGRPIPDEDLFLEPHGAFHPTCIAEAARISLRVLPLPVEERVVAIPARAESDLIFLPDRARTLAPDYSAGLSWGHL
jgi:hypothetical protein